MKTKTARKADGLIDDFNVEIIDKHLVPYQKSLYRLQQKITQNQKTEFMRCPDKSIFINGRADSYKKYYSNECEFVPDEQLDNWYEYTSLKKDQELMKTQISCLLREVTENFMCDDRLEFITGCLYPQHLKLTDCSDDFDAKLAIFKRKHAVLIKEMQMLRLKAIILKAA